MKKAYFIEENNTIEIYNNLLSVILSETVFQDCGRLTDCLKPDFKLWHARRNLGSGFSFPLLKLFLGSPEGCLLVGRMERATLLVPRFPKD